MPVTKPTETTRPSTAPPAPEAKPEDPTQAIPDGKPASELADVRAAFEASWARHESAYRYLGR